MQGLYVIVFGLLSVNIVSSVVVPDDTLLKLLQGFEDIKKQLNANEVILKSLQAAFEQRTTSFSNGCSIRDITDAIKTQKFELAEELIRELADMKKISQIIHIAYAGSPANMDLIVEFAKGLNDGDTKLQVFHALHEEMRLSGNSDPFKLITLVEAMEKELARNQNIRPDTKAKVKSEIDRAIVSVKDAAVNILKTAMINDKYVKNSEVEDLATVIFNFHTDVSNEVMEGTVDSVFGVVAAKKIISYVSSHKHIPQVVAGLTAIFNRFNYAGNLNNEAILDLASDLRELQLRNDYNAMDQKLRTEIDDIVERLPACARNLHFHSRVCFWSRAKRAFMYAASSEFSYDKERRSIFTWYSGNVVNGAVWEVQKIDGYYFFKNAHHANEYLYSVDGGTYSKDMRYIFTWIPGHNTDPQSRWIIELDGNHCYIKTAFNNEYMFASSVKYNKFSSNVFTWIGPTLVRSAEYQWELRNCD